MIEHPGIEELMAYPLGELTVERSRQVWQHCSGCAECGNELAAIILVRSAAVTDEPAERPAWNWKYLVIAASIIVVVGLGFLFSRTLRDPADTEAPRLNVPATSAQSEYAALATRETLPQSHVDFRFGTAVLAGTNQGRVRDAVQAIVDERFEQAEQALEVLLRANPSDREVSVHLGVARYFRGDLSGGTETLLRSERPVGSLGRTGYWYLGNLLLARGEIADARLVLESLTGADDRWGRRATALLQQLERF